jgi:hypothetical protein
MRLLSTRIFFAALTVAALAVLTSFCTLAQEGQRPSPEEIFRRLDKNADGKLSPDEVKGFPRLEQALKDGDANGDGVLTLDELKAYIAKRTGGQPQGEKKAVAQKPGEKPAEKPAAAEGIAFFEKKIRPVLVAQCYKCHSAESEKIRGGLVLDTREGIRKGGDNGPAVVPGDLKKSLLIKALHHNSDTLKMPPKEKLSDEVIQDFETWVKMGAPDPRDGKKVAHADIDIEKGRQYWAFQLPKKTTPPAVKDQAWPRTDVDRFLLAALESKGLHPVGDAESHVLIRRLYFDLIGLPPTPEQIDAFMTAAEKDRQKALEAVVDELLASPRFGERWGRHWLDVVRFAESTGRQNNFLYPHAWRYRDYVINSFNADKPYDQFIREQIAGDLLPAKDDKQKAEQLIATGFLALGPKVLNERNRQQFAMDQADEQLDVTTQAFLGLTVGCARCHDHKFDPIPQKDYYAMVGIFRSTETCYGTIRVIQNNQPAALVQLPREVPLPNALDRLTPEARERLQKQLADARKERSEVRPGDMNQIFKIIRLQTQIATIQSQLDSYFEDGTPKNQAMGVRDARFASDSRLYERGELDKPGETVKRGFPQVVATKQPTITRGSGRRELAAWLASAENPLTARVLVNRVWLHLFGRGIVPTPDNFGNAGQPPTNQALLDALAVSFVEQGWSVKKLIRSLVLSRAYQLDSKYDGKCAEIDPENALVWRMSRRRLEAEPLRDAMLAISGRLDTTPAKASPVARAGEGNAFRALRFGGPGGGDDRHRTVYTPIIRDQLPESLTLFDFAEPGMVVGERPTTTVPAQSLYLMNNPFVIRQAEAAADRLLAREGTDSDKLRHAWMTFFGRPATDKEVEKAEAFLDRYAKARSGDKDDPKARRAAWAALTQALFGSAEFQYRD